DFDGISVVRKSAREELIVRLAGASASLNRQEREYYGRHCPQERMATARNVPGSRRRRKEVDRHQRLLMRRFIHQRAGLLRGRRAARPPAGARPGAPQPAARSVAPRPAGPPSAAAPPSAA